MKKKILVVSDTHGYDYWLELLEINKYDYVIHAGDHLIPKLMKEITPYFVDGNNDWGNKNIDIFEIDGMKVLLVHGDEQHVSGCDKNYIIECFKDLVIKHQPKIVIFGHTHIPFLDDNLDTIYLNPGSMWMSRHNGKKCYAEIEYDGKNIDISLKQY